MALVKSMVFVDGENITIRYQALLETGRRPRPSVVHVADTFVWNRDFATQGISGINTDVMRVAYYTSVVGDDPKVAEMRDQIAALHYGVAYQPVTDFYGSCQLTPRVFKKPMRSQKSRMVDIGIVIDVMRHACARDTDVVYLFSGDGDFLELVYEAARQGQKVCVAAFSSGLDPRLKSAGERFVVLDDLFLLPATASDGAG